MWRPLSYQHHQSYHSELSGAGLFLLLDEELPFYNPDLPYLVDSSVRY